MPSVTETRLQPSSMNPPVSYADYIIGAAIFDLNGLPKEYYTTSESSNMSWVQTIFQALGLRSLLMSSLQLEGFRHSIIHGSEYCAVVVKQKAHYTALLVQQRDDLISDGFIQWVHSFELSDLKQNPRFRVA